MRCLSPGLGDGFSVDYGCYGVHEPPCHSLVPEDREIRMQVLVLGQHGSATEQEHDHRPPYPLHYICCFLGHVCSSQKAVTPFGALTEPSH